MIISAAKYSGAQYIIAFLLAIYSHRHQIASLWTFGDFQLGGYPSTEEQGYKSKNCCTKKQACHRMSKFSGEDVSAF